jgi:hypothetical protein
MKRIVTKNKYTLTDLRKSKKKPDSDSAEDKAKFLKEKRDGFKLS